MLKAMGKDDFLVLGHEHRDIDYERVWRNHLSKVSHAKSGRLGNVELLCGCPQGVFIKTSRSLGA